MTSNHLSSLYPLALGSLVWLGFCLMSGPALTFLGVAALSLARLAFSALPVAFTLLPDHVPWTTTPARVKPHVTVSFRHCVLTLLNPDPPHPEGAALA